MEEEQEEDIDEEKQEEELSTEGDERLSFVFFVNFLS